METPLSTRAALLQALAVPGYGLQLVERVRRASGGRVRLRLGGVYPALQVLEREGLVKARAVGHASRGRPRRYYELTWEGVAAAMEQRAALMALLHAPISKRVGQSDAAAMREGLESCSDLSGAVVELRDRVRRATRRR